MQKNKKILLAVVSVLILMVFMLYFYYRPITEIYYKITGKIVEKKDSIEVWIEPGSSLNDLKNSNPPKDMCSVPTKDQLSKCMFIRSFVDPASIVNWPEHPTAGKIKIDIICTYGCPK